jgi:PAS domain S-box-containing protein
LGGLYFLVGILIGWLKETVDKLIEKEAEGRIRLQSVIQQLPVGIIVANEDGTITHQNKRLEKILGYKLSKDFIVGKTSISDGINPQETPISQALLAGKSTNSKQFEIKNKDKTTYVLVNATPVRNRMGKIVAAVSVIDDITREKQLEKRKDDFINIASHELKTPITSMKLYIDLLIKNLGKNDNQELNALKRIQYQTDKLQMLVGNLLDVSKISNGKIRFNKEEFKLDDLVEDTIEEMKTISTDHEIKLERSSVKVFADKFRIYQVLTNLLTNAIKFSPNSKQIMVSVGKKNGKAQVSVKDFGIGIGKREQSKIFERLYQVEDGEKTFPGFGMGLYISRQIINRHEGKIWAESLKGSGSIFYFSLPLKK